MKGPLPRACKLCWNAVTLVSPRSLLRLLASNRSDEACVDLHGAGAAGAVDSDANAGLLEIHAQEIELPGQLRRAARQLLPLPP